MKRWRICLSCAFQEDQQQTRNEYQQEEHRCLPNACTLNWLCKTMTQLITILTQIHNQTLVLMTKLTKIPPEALALSEIYNLNMMEPNTNRLNHRFTLNDLKYWWKLRTWFLLLVWLKKGALIYISWWESDYSIWKWWWVILAKEWVISHLVRLIFQRERIDVIGQVHHWVI